MQSISIPCIPAVMERSSKMVMAEERAKRLIRRNSKKVTAAEETAKRLTETEDLLIQILARLPMESIMRFRAVCKRWNEMFQSPEFRQLASSMAVSTTPAFVIVQEMIKPLYLRNLLINTDSSYRFHSLSLNFLPSPVFVGAGCKSLLCCCSGKNEIFICNPLTKTWIQLPDPTGHESSDFFSLAFDARAICCTLLLGRKSAADSNTVIQIYDSKSNKWTQSEIPSGSLIRPGGEGIYSNGKYYWLNDVHDGESLSIVTLDVQQRLWNTIRGPRLSLTSRILLKSDILFKAFVKVIGFEGHIFLVLLKYCDCLWKLNTDEAEEEKWSKTFGDTYLQLGTLITVNESGCALSFDTTTHNITVRSEEGKLVQNIQLWEIMDMLLSEYSHSQFSVRAFQVNNIWWP